MTLWILAGLALWFAQVFYAASFKTVLAEGATAAVQDHMRGKDQAVAVTIHGGRAQRGVQNLQESMLAFLPLALLLHMEGYTEGLGVQGAILFLVARVMYVPAYHMAVFGVRTAAWFAGFAGLCMMAAALLGFG